MSMSKQMVEQEFEPTSVHSKTSQSPPELNIEPTPINLDISGIPPGLRIEPAPVHSKTSQSPQGLKNETSKQEEPVKQLGITSCVNPDPPTKNHYLRSHQLSEWFKTLNILESKEDLSRKYAILEKLNKITKRWIVGFLMKQRMPESEARKVGGHIRTFGSYRLGIHTKGGDIDAVLVVPMHIMRKDFNESFSAYLSSCGDVKNLRVIPDAYVPLMKFNLSGIDFDLLFCRIKSYRVSDDIPLNDAKVLRDMDLKCARSINGFRIAEDILNLVPSQKNFKFVLHVIRLWAKKHELYSNIVGFFGGITWAILVARICQLYPRSAPSFLINRFFMAFSGWDWDNHPVVLKKIIYGLYSMTHPQWHISAADRNKLMSIITPTYPEQNTVHNVTLSTRAILIKKMDEAFEKTTKILSGKLPWSSLFIADNFFQSYNHFLILSTHSVNEKKHVEFNGYIESRLRVLVGTLEKNIFINVVHPYPKSYPAKPEECLPNTTRWFFGLDINKPDENASINIDMHTDLTLFEYEVMGRSHFCMTNPDNKITFTYSRRKELKKFLTEDIVGKSVKKIKKTLVQDIPLSSESIENLLPLGSKRKSDLSDYTPVDKINSTTPSQVTLNGVKNILPNDLGTNLNGGRNLEKR